MAKQHLSIPAGPLPNVTAQRPAPTPVTGTPSIKVERVEVQKTEQPLAGVVIGFKSNSVIGDPEQFPIAVADTITSGFDYPTGYMFEILRGRGLVYVVHAYDSPGRNAAMPGSFIVYAGCDPKNVNEVVDVILESMARTQGTAADMNADWVERSKQLITTSDALQNETAAQQASTAALDELYGLGYNYHDQFAAKINAVTIEQVREVTRKKLWEAVVTVSTPAPEVVKKETGTRTYPTFPPVDLTPRGVQHETVR
jgi:zinc protease